MTCLTYCDLELTDYTKGFGGKFGVETDKVDKSAMGFEYLGKTEKHESQKGQPPGAAERRLSFSPSLIRLLSPHS